MPSSLEVYHLQTGAQVVLRSERLIEAPNWSPDGSELLVNAEGRLWRVPLSAPALVAVDTGPADRCNNDHGFSPDGRWIILSSHHGGNGAEIFLMPREGGALCRVSPQAPSWWHGVSPDGQDMVYAAARDGREVGICRCPLHGGAETRLTSGDHHSDGPDYSADGTRIYFNSDRCGHAQIWIMSADGRDQRPLFSDDRVNWFPHPSPDGLHLVYLSYPPGTLGHPRDLPVEIMLCNAAGSERRRLVSLVGGQGTMNVPNWSPDGLAFAYVRYG